MSILLTSIVTGLSVFLFVLWYARSKSTMESRVRGLADQQRLVVEYGDPFTQRVAFPVIDGLVTTLANILPTSMITRAKRWLVIAGARHFDNRERKSSFGRCYQWLADAVVLPGEPESMEGLYFHGG